jgi:hypothetical protein
MNSRFASHVRRVNEQNCLIDDLIFVDSILESPVPQKARSILTWRLMTRFYILIIIGRRYIMDLHGRLNRHHEESPLMKNPLSSHTSNTSIPTPTKTPLVS